MPLSRTKEKGERSRTGPALPGASCAGGQVSASPRKTRGGRPARRGLGPQPQTLIWMLRLQFPCSDTGRPGAGYALTPWCITRRGCGKMPGPISKARRHCRERREKCVRLPREPLFLGRAPPTLSYVSSRCGYRCHRGLQS